MGYLLPSLAAVCCDISARRRFVARRADALAPADAALWVGGKGGAAFNPWVILALVGLLARPVCTVQLRWEWWQFLLAQGGSRET